MWDLGTLNRGIFLLISVLTGCAILYNAWGPILALIISIIFVIYVCYSLLTNDSIIISPNQTLVFIKYMKEAFRDINGYSNLIIFYLSSTIRKLYIILNNNYRIYVVNKMNKYRQNHYQLSNDNNQETTRNSSIFDLTTNQLSPISRNDYRENISYNNQLRNDYTATKLTSTPLAPLRKDANLLSNGVIGLYTPNRPLRQETQLTYGPNHTSVRSNESVFSPEGSPWGTSISPKIRSKAGGVKTVQTVAGPLLASTRYNIDPKVYSDVTSPGLSTRLAKYATEANSKLTHQSQYGTGQFPKVNLSASPLPLISAKNVKVKIPVTVRIAPPEASGYSPPERQKLISDVCRAESKASSQSVVQVLREISLKRHASREDVSSDLVKKQRTDGLFDENLDNFEEESKQKRTREDSPNTDDEILDRNNQPRPIKKTKTPSCFDVLNSLSSSNQYSSGIKRKASTLDLSRSGTPDIEKHFKPSETTVQNIPKIVITVTEPHSEIRKSEKHDLNEKFSPNMEVEVNKILREQQSAIRMKGILKNQIGKEDGGADQEHNRSIESPKQIEEKKNEEIQLTKKSSPVEKTKPVNFRDKLFMKAGPENNERLRTMIQEQGNIRAKFTTDDVEEIKKEDIVNMRQTSMRARLQSMFDAISGKPSKKINPDVIIHAEGAGEPNTPQTTSASLVTLSSTTSTTNINTSPIATSLVAPTVADSKLNSTTVTKHVTFNLPSTQSSGISQSSSMNAIATTEIKTNTTAASISSSEAPKLSFGTVLSTTKVSKSPSTTNSMMLSFPNSQNTNATTVAALSSVNSNTGPSAFMNSTQSLGNPSLAVSSSINNSSNVVATQTTVAKVLSPSSSAAFTSSNYSIVNKDVNPVSSAKTSTTFGTVNPSSSVISSGNFTSEPNKSIELAKTSTQSTSSPMPNFSFGASKTSSSNVTQIFGGNVQSNSVNNTRNETLSTTNVSNTVSPSTNPSFVSSGGVMQTQQSGFNGTPTTGGIMVSSNNPTSTTSSLFAFGGSTALPQSTNAGSFSFTTNTSTGKSQVPAFGSTATQNSPAFGNTGTQNPPSYENTINFQNNQSSGTNNSTTTTQNAPLFGNNLSSNQNPTPAFGSAVTTAQNANSTFGTVASSAPPPAFGNTSTTNSSFAFGNTTAQTPSSTISTGFGTNNNSTAPSTATTSATNPTFSFGSSTTSTTKSSFAFGSNAPATTTASNTGIIQGTTGNSNQTTAFGSNAGNSAPVFGAPSTTAPPAFGAAPATSTPVFGAPSSTTSSVFGGIAATITPVFGTGTSTTATPLFGSPATTTTTAMFDGSANQSTFGNVSNPVAPSGFGTPKTTAPPAFGSSTNNSGFNYAGNTGNSLFSGTSLATTSNNALPATASSTFGGNAISKSVFGQTAAKPPPSFAASTSATFGSGGTANFGNSSSSFGTTSNSIPTGNPPAYGAQNSTTGSFGTQNQTVKQTPQGPPPPFGATNSAFGSTTTAPPAFGANTSTPSAFGSSASTFGSQNTNAPPSFGAASTANTAPAFGANVSATFGGQSQTSTPAFGAQNSAAQSFGTTNNNNSNAAFGFGGNQTVQQQQNSGFPFSGTAANTNNNATTAAPFQFGGTTAKSEEFNFNASTTTANMNFGATSQPSFGTQAQGSNIFGTQSPAVPAGGMFSIGAGSTAPRSRTSRPRRQR